MNAISKHEELKMFLSKQIEEKRRLMQINKEVNEQFAMSEMQKVIERDENQKASESKHKQEELKNLNFISS